jgi:hypothetical protein
VDLNSTPHYANLKKFKKCSVGVYVAGFKGVPFKPQTLINSIEFHQVAWKR